MNCKKRQIQKRKRKWIYRFLQLGVLILFLGLWEILARWNIIDEFLISKPSSIIKLFIKYVENGEIWKHIWISLIETILGMVIGSALGILFAVFLWYFPKIEKVLDPFLVVLNALPKTALAPIIIIWAGTDIKGIVVVAISILFVLTVLSSYKHFQNVDEEKIKMLKSMHATRFQILKYLIIPSNIGNLMSVIKINIGMAWVGVIVGEFLVSRAGIGYLIMYGGSVFRLDLVMMGVVILAILAWGLYAILQFLENYIKRKRGKS